jgi:hypothetical protein
LSKKYKRNNRINKPELVRKAAIPQGSTVTPLTQLADRLTQQQQNHYNGSQMFAPGIPLQPVTGVTPPEGPRQYGYQPGINLDFPRAEEDIQFSTMEALADNYDGIGLAEQRFNEIIDLLEPKIGLRKELQAEGDDEKKYANEIAAIADFFESPDKESDLKEWMKKAVKDRLRYDAVAIFPHLTRGGGLYSLELLDGKSIKPLLNDRGMRPLPPDPAYTQYLYGVPVAWLNSEQLIYMKETPSNDSVYGKSRVQRIIMRVQQALRKQSFDLAHYTDGNVPAGMVELPADGTQWTSTEIEDYEKMFNSLLVGNDKARRRIKVMMPGAKYTPFQEAVISPELDRFLLNVTAAMYSLTLAGLGFTETVNKSSGDGQENVEARRAIKPIAIHFARLFTRIIRKYFDPRFTFSWAGFEEAEDFNQQALGFSTLIQRGVVSPSTVAKIMKLPVEVEVPPFIIVQGQGVVTMEEIAQMATPEVLAAKKDAAMNGLKQAATIQQDPQDPGQGDDNQDGGDSQDDPPGDEQDDSEEQD